ncbi:MAG TPA: hypothetical protein VK845_03805 [Gemmatimonadales bacterium]|nr:hypothetical protein [Gemmatimonadales bacterium]
MWKILLVCMLVLMPSQDSHAQSSRPAEPKNYIYFGRDRQRTAELRFLSTSAIVGAQLKYTWRELEPERDRYALELIRQDLDFLQSQGKQLFIQLQDVSFDEAIVNVPDYLVEDSTFHGGVAMQYGFEGDDESRPIREGWVARRWDPAVRERLSRLLRVLASEFDGRIAGVNLPETAVGFGEGGDLWPEDFTPPRYFEAIKDLMTAARNAFQKSDVILYANFMPGEELPRLDRGYLKGLYQHAARVGVGVGGPDLLPHRRGQRQNSLPLIAGRPPGIVAGMAVQWGNLEDVNPATGMPVTVLELAGFARDGLRLDYVFWGTQEPFYSTNVLPYLESLEDPNPNGSR